MNQNYQIIIDESKLDEFISFLPDIEDTEVYYLCLFGRHKYAAEFPNTKDSGQLARIASRKSDLKEKIRRLECPLGSFSRDGAVAPQEALAVYIGLNPRSLIQANKKLLVELATRIAEGDLSFNPISAATTEIHRAVSRKFFVDFDYDHVEPVDYLPKIKEILPDGAYKILKTRGGFHLVVELAKMKNPPKKDWHKLLASLPNCDVRGSKNLTPVPGCTQGGFTPYFLGENDEAKSGQ
jgi:hypothetical protein